MAAMTERAKTVVFWSRELCRPQDGGPRLGGSKGGRKRSCPRLRTYRWIIRRHPISRAVLER